MQDEDDFGNGKPEIYSKPTFPSYEQMMILRATQASEQFNEFEEFDQNSGPSQPKK